MSVIKNFLRNHDELEFLLKRAYFGFHGFLESYVPAKQFLKIQYFIKTGERLNVDNPKTFNEKIQWLKLNYKNPELHRCVDKWNVREFVREKGLEHLLIPAWGPYDSVDEIDFDALPSSFIMKLTNGSSFNILCKDKSSFDKVAAKRKFDSWVGINFYAARREWAYKGVPNKIICEELLVDKSGGLPSDIRFFCFDGEPKFIAVDLDSVVNGVKTSNYYRHIYTCQWEVVDATIQYPKKPNYEVEKPENLEELLSIARTLAQGFPFVRVDLYNVDSKPYFGELTFYHASGYQKIMPESFRYQLGEQMPLLTR